jgi:hypothetical protein
MTSTRRAFVIMSCHLPRRRRRNPPAKREHALMESGVRVSHGRIEAVRGTDLTVVPEFFWLPRKRSVRGACR